MSLNFQKLQESYKYFDIDEKNINKIDLYLQMTDALKFSNIKNKQGA